jgi:hypothetical protein
MMQSALSALALNAFVPELAPLVLLAFFGAGFLVFATATGAAIALAARRRGPARFLGAAGLAVAVIYDTLLLGASLVSRERTLAPGERKYFCEMDCHLAYDVAAVTSPSETLLAVTVRTWFDPSTIASARGNGPLIPNPRVVSLVDASGRRFAPSAEATRAWESAQGHSVPLTRMLSPGESYKTTFVFEVPPGIREPRLFLGDPAGPENLLIGHENSPFHRKVYFALDPSRTAAR